MYHTGHCWKPRERKQGRPKRNWNERTDKEMGKRGLKENQ